MQSEINAIGIDLGTTYSAVAIMDKNGNTEIIPNAETERLTPSAVFFDEDSILVGQIAKDAIVTNPDDVIMFAKRQIGNTNWHVRFDQQQMSAIDVSAMVLKKLKADSEKYLNRSLPYAVITVPAYFDDSRRRATKTAAEIAGFTVLDLINEPTAAAIGYGVSRNNSPETILIYDLGGGTFDVTIMRVDGEKFDVIATDGDHQLGGKDFDDAIIRSAVLQFKEQHGFDPTEDEFAAGELRTNAEKAKRELSKRSKTAILVRSNGKTTRVSIDRATFEGAIKPKIDTTLTLIRSVLRDAKLEAGHIDRVLLIGGPTRMPLVHQSLVNFFNLQPDATVNPDEAVAIGAAIVSAKKFAELKPEEVTQVIAEKVAGLQISDVTSHSLGIEASVPGTTQLINSILIKRNSPLPASISKEFTTTIPDQRSIKVTIYQGEFQDPKLCNPIGDFLLAGLPPNRPPGRKVRVTVECGTDGVVTVSATDIESGKQAETKVSYKVGQSKQQVSARQRWLDAKPIS